MRPLLLLVCYALCTESKNMDNIRILKNISALDEIFKLKNTFSNLVLKLTLTMYLLKLENHREIYNRRI